MKRKKTLKYGFISFFAIVMFLLSFTVIYDLLIPDVCYYHMNEMNPFMNLFYSEGGGGNGHPEPNFFNLIISLLVGGLIGYQVHRIIFKSIND